MNRSSSTKPCRKILRLAFIFCILFEESLITDPNQIECPDSNLNSTLNWIHVHSGYNGGGIFHDISHHYCSVDDYLASPFTCDDTSGSIDRSYLSAFNKSKGGSIKWERPFNEFLNNFTLLESTVVKDNFISSADFRKSLKNYIAKMPIMAQDGFSKKLYNFNTNDNVSRCLKTSLYAFLTDQNDGLKLPIDTEYYDTQVPPYINFQYNTSSNQQRVILIEFQYKTREYASSRSGGNYINISDFDTINDFFDKMYDHNMIFHELYDSKYYFVRSYNEGGVNMKLEVVSYDSTSILPLIGSENQIINQTLSVKRRQIEALERKREALKTFEAQRSNITRNISNLKDKNDCLKAENSNLKRANNLEEIRNLNFTTSAANQMKGLSAQLDEKKAQLQSSINDKNKCINQDIELKEKIRKLGLAGQLPSLKQKLNELKAQNEDLNKEHRALRVFALKQSTLNYIKLLIVNTVLISIIILLVTMIAVRKIRRNRRRNAQSN